MIRFTLFLLLFFTGKILAQPEDFNASKIQLQLKKLNVLGTVLYLAAHPDDENTRLITYYSKGRLLNTAYMSLTRGDGGQNSIGPEIAEQLGLLRTQELLSARRIDGGKQFFSRAIDFGYSKTADETLQIWDSEKLLSDLVWVIRNWRPDIIVTRFPPDDRAGHGQHEASALLGMEAFDLAGDPEAFPEQLSYIDTWQPERIVVNTGWWWNRDIKASDPGVSAVDVGGYSPLLGYSYTEIAAESRSQHKSQSFGVSSTRGESIEYLEHGKGTNAEDDPLEGIDLSWNRVEGSEGIPEMVRAMGEKFDPERPHLIIDDLLRLRQRISQLDDEFWKQRKINEIDYLIRACAGLFYEARADRSISNPGDSVTVTFEFINRSDAEITLEDISSLKLNIDTSVSKSLVNNEQLLFTSKKILPANLSYSNPFWLEHAPSLGHYTIKDQQLVGKAENDPTISFKVNFKVNDQPVSYTMPLVYRWTDNIKGEVYQPFEIGPPLYISLQDKVYIFPENSPRQVTVRLQPVRKGLTGELILNVPGKWEVEPRSVTFKLENEEKVISFQVYPPKKQSEGSIQAIAEIDGKRYDRGIATVDYNHIPQQTLFPKAQAKVVRIDLQKYGQTIGYIEGAGDAVAGSLEQIGYDVTILNKSDLTPQRLKPFDAVVVGVMAFNMDSELGKYREPLLNYVHNGGNLILQYNNGRVGFKSELIAPYPIELTGRSAASRVSVEQAEVKILDLDHPVMNVPNKITRKDFEGWVQERGLYFPVKWDDNYTALFSSHDPGQEPLEGGLLVTQYGEGYYVYTAYSWFRQLPAGVPGAYRIFTNLISLGRANGKASIK